MTTTMKLTPQPDSEILTVEDQTRERKKRTKAAARAIAEGTILPQQTEGYAESLSPDKHLRAMFAVNDSSETFLRRNPANLGTADKWRYNTTVTSALTGGFMLLSNPLAMTSFLSAAAVAVGTMAVTRVGILGTLGAINLKAAKTHYKLAKLAEPGFLQWLKSRYGIVISAEVSKGLATSYTFGANGYNPGFTDSITGEKYELVTHTHEGPNGRSYFLKVANAGNKYSEAITVEQKRSKEEKRLLDNLKKQTGKAALTEVSKKNKKVKNRETDSSPTLEQKILTDLA